MPRALPPRRWSSWSLLAFFGLAACAAERGEDAPAAQEPPTASAHLALADGAPRVVVTEELQEGLARGPVSLASATGVVTLRRAVDDAVATPAQRAWVGRRVRLSGAAGVVCEGTVRSLSVEARVMPDTSLVDALTGEDAPEGERPTLDSLWELASGAGRVALVADVDGERGCDGALWAEPAEASAKLTRGVDDADDATRALALAEFRKLPAWEDAAARWSDDLAARDEAAPDVARWDEVGGAPDVKLVEGGSLVIVSKDVGGGCGEFDASITAVFRVRGGAAGPTLELANDPGRGRAFDVLGAVDLDGDGALDLLVPGGFRRGAALDDAVTSDVPFLGCPC